LIGPGDTTINQKGERMNVS